MTEPFNTLKELRMSNGVVLRCRAVPPYASTVVRTVLPEPPYPKVAVKSAAGGQEVLPALPGSEEHEEYRVAQAKYRRELTVALFDFNTNYSVVEWQLPGGEEWYQEPPEDWDVPEVMKRYGVPSSCPQCH
jgi:hypothetical protein